MEVGGLVGKGRCHMLSFNEWHVVTYFEASDAVCPSPNYSDL